MLKNKIVILGAGSQGACTALELAKQGIHVTLIDQDPVPMNRASLRNEGKIHLGLIYANDLTLNTGTMQLKGALYFRHLLTRWLGEKTNNLTLGTPFYYLVAQDSIFSPEELTKHYQKLESLYKDILKDNPHLDYLGTKPSKFYRQLEKSEIEQYFVSQQFITGFATPELAIDTEQLAQLIRAAIKANPLIDFLPNHKVKSITRTNNDLLKIEGTNAEGSWQLTSEQVVNATWESRLALDQSLGLPIEKGWLHRLKYRTIVKLPPSLLNAPSATIVLGRYGDVVIRPDGTAYLSWYPSGLQGWSHDLLPPNSWDAACRGEPDSKRAKEIANSTKENIDNWMPGIKDSTLLLIDAGAIVAYGKSDVDDRESGLHDRTKIGVTSIDGYHSADPGKLTTAPLFAMAAAEKVINHLQQNKS